MSGKNQDNSGQIWQFLVPRMFPKTARDPRKGLWPAVIWWAILGLIISTTRRINRADRPGACPV